MDNVKRSVDQIYLDVWLPHILQDAEQANFFDILRVPKPWIFGKKNCVYGSLYFPKFLFDDLGLMDSYKHNCWFRLGSKLGKIKNEWVVLSIGLLFLAFVIETPS